MSEENGGITVLIEGEEIQLQEAERTKCEIWTRVMGYHRPTMEFNPGKTAEHKERRYFQESQAGRLLAPGGPDVAEALDQPDTSSPAIQIGAPVMTDFPTLDQEILLTGTDG